MAPDGRVLCLILRVMHALIKTGKNPRTTKDYRRQNGKIVLKPSTKSVAGVIFVDIRHVS